MRTVDFQKLVCDDEWRIVGFFRTETEADQVATVAEWQAKHAETIALTGTLGDQFAVAYPLTGLSADELRALLAKAERAAIRENGAGNYGEQSAQFAASQRERAIRKALVAVGG
jgi:hypothetical protein